MIPKEKLEALRVDMQEIANMVAVTGVSYFKAAFRNKEFNGSKWPEAKVDKNKKRKRGSLMVESAALMNSVRTAEATPEQVKWTAGNDKVPYAQVHNEGGRAGRGAGFDMPQRQFMGESEELEEKITKRISSYLGKVLK